MSFYSYCFSISILISTIPTPTTSFYSYSNVSLFLLCLSITTMCLFSNFVFLFLLGLSIPTRSFYSYYVFLFLLCLSSLTMSFYSSMSNYKCEFVSGKHSVFLYRSYPCKLASLWTDCEAWQVDMTDHLMVTWHRRIQKSSDQQILSKSRFVEVVVRLWPFVYSLLVKQHWFIQEIFHS